MDRNTDLTIRLIKQKENLLLQAIRIPNFRKIGYICLIVSCALMAGIMYVRPMLVEKYPVFVNSVIAINTIGLISGVLLASIFESRAKNKYIGIIKESIEISVRLKEMI